jgi:hypothetical protein
MWGKNKKPLLQGSVGILPASSFLVGRRGLAAPILSEKIHRAEQVVKSKAAWMGQDIPSKNWDYKSQPQFLAYDLFRLLWVSLVFRDPSCLS